MNYRAMIALLLNSFTAWSYLTFNIVVYYDTFYSSDIFYYFATGLVLPLAFYLGIIIEKNKILETPERMIYQSENKYVWEIVYPILGLLLFIGILFNQVLYVFIWIGPGVILLAENFIILGKITARSERKHLDYLLILPILILILPLTMLSILIVEIWVLLVIIINLIMPIIFWHWKKKWNTIKTD